MSTNYWHEKAKECNAIAAANGFDLPTWDNLPIKLMLVVTELHEAADGARGSFDNFNLPEELADIAIRLLSILHSLFSSKWEAEYDYSDEQQREYKFDSLEHNLFHISRSLAEAVENWRSNDVEMTKFWLEVSLQQVRTLARAYDYNLILSIDIKCEKNKTRQKLHGKARSDG